MLKHFGTVVVEVGVLLTRELANAHAGVDAPRIEKLVPDLGNDHQILAAGKFAFCFGDHMKLPRTSARYVWF